MTDDGTSQTGLPLGAVKSARAAYILLLLLGLLGAHRFYLGRGRTGVAILALTLIGAMGVSPALLGSVVWLIVDAFLIPGWIREHNGTAGLLVDRSRVWSAVHWGGGALGFGLAGLVLLAAFVPKPEPAPEPVPEIVASERIAPLPSSATENAPWETAVVAAPEPLQKAPEERIAEILSRPDEQEPWSDASISRHAEMRGLYRAFLTFRDSAEFRRYGFGAGGPYGAWMQAVLHLNSDREYASRLYDRCEVVPDDLRRHARDHMNGRFGPQVRADGAAWAACFPD